MLQSKAVIKCVICIIGLLCSCLRYSFGMPKDSLLFSQGPATGPYPELDESSLTLEYLHIYA
jgi:hypothetical protein